MKRTSDRLLSLLLLSYLFVSPLLYSSAVYEGFLLPRVCFIFLVIALILPLFTIRLIRQGIAFSLPVDIYFLGVLFAVLLSWLGVKDTATFIFNVSFLLAAYFTYFVVANIINTPKLSKLFLGALFVSTTIVALIGLIQYLVYQEVIKHCPYFPIPYRPAGLRMYGDRVYSTFGQPNTMGLYLSLGLIVCLYFLLEAKAEATWKKWSITAGMLLACGLIVFVLDASGGLGVYCGLTAVVVYFGLGKIYLGSKWLAARKLKIALFVLVITGTLFFSQTVLPETSSLQRTISSVQYTAGEVNSYGSITNRLIYWRTSLEIFRGSPLWGVGLGQFGLNYMPALAGLILRTNSDFLKDHAYPANYAHNEFLQFLAETGLVGFLLFGLIWFIVCKHTLKTLKSNPSPLLLVTGSLFIPFFVQCLLSAPLRRLSLLVILAFLLAIWGRLIPSNKERHYKVSARLGKLLMPLVLLLSLSITWGVYDNWRAAEIMRKVIDSNKTEKFIQPALIDKIGVNPYIKFELTTMVAKKALTLGVKQNRKEWVEVAYELYQQVLLRLPTHKYCRYMAIACFYLGKEQEGMQYIRQGLSYVPWDSKLRRMLKHYQSHLDHALPFF